MGRQKTAAIDFDGTIANYDGWQGKGNFLPPVDGAKEAIQTLYDEGWLIVIHTCRAETDDVREYLNKYGIPFDYINYNPANVEFGNNLGKPYADVYIDDRALTFDGNWAKMLNDVRKFAPWGKKGA